MKDNLILIILIGITALLGLIVIFDWNNNSVIQKNGEKFEVILTRHDTLRLSGISETPLLFSSLNELCTEACANRCTSFGYKYNGSDILGQQEDILVSDWRNPTNWVGIPDYWAVDSCKCSCV